MTRRRERGSSVTSARRSSDWPCVENGGCFAPPRVRYAPTQSLRPDVTGIASTLAMTHNSAMRNWLSGSLMATLTLSLACSPVAPVTPDIPIGGSGGDASPEDAAIGAGDAMADASLDDGGDAGARDGGKDAGMSDGGDAGLDAGPPAVRYVGRFDTSDSAGPKASYPGVRTIVRFEGTGLDATLTQADGFGGGPSFFDTIVDGTLQSTPFSVSAGTSTVSVATGLAAGAHTVELYKRTEARQGTVQFRGFSYPGGGRLLAPAPPRTRRIEIIGNSAVGGYGIESPTTNCPGNTLAGYSNARKSVGALAAETLNADLAITGNSGKGVTLNADVNDRNTLPILFERTLPENGTSVWTHSKFVPDAVVIGMPNLDIDTPDPALGAAYDAFLMRIRAVYPGAHIFVVVTAYSTDSFPVGVMTRTRFINVANAVAARRVAAGDSKVYAYAMTEYVNGQLTGCGFHPGPALTAQMANELVPWLRTRLGW
jgi:hypothetical protein